MECDALGSAALHLEGLWLRLQEKLGYEERVRG